MFLRSGAWILVGACWFGCGSSSDTPAVDALVAHDAAFDAAADGSVAGARDEYAAAGNDVISADCSCDPAGVTVQQCVDLRDLDGDLLACQNQAVAGVLSEWSAHLTCETAALRQFASCYQAVSGCEPTAIGACQDAFDGRACPAPSSSAQIAYDQALAACIAGAASTCPEASSSALGAAVFAGTTVGAGNDLSPSCGGSAAPDRAFSWTAPSTGTFVFDTIGSDYDTLLALSSTCGSGEHACNDDELALYSQVVRAMSSGETVIVVVDGFTALTAGAFVVNISAQ
jgi:hypothetical protein